MPQANSVQSNHGFKVVVPVLFIILAFASLKPSDADESGSANRPLAVSFATGGKFKMLYDCRQRPQCVVLQGRLYIVFNGDATTTQNSKGKAFPMLTSYDLNSRVFELPVRLSEKDESDHHFSPVIWADSLSRLHVLFGCHKTPGTHLVSDQSIQGEPEVRWVKAGQIAPSISYPTIYQIEGKRELIYYRTEGHTSSWTYRISEDNGHSWQGPSLDVTDLDCKGKLDWSSYHTKVPSRDGRHLHVVFTDYDDNKHQATPDRFFNPRYESEVSNEWKYNLHYLKVDLQTHSVANDAGQMVRTPVDLDYAKSQCQIWDTEWRGAGIPPVIALDLEQNPTFLHVISEDSTREHRYYYVRRKDGVWLKTPIATANHQWNSGYLSHRADGSIRAFLIVGAGYLEGGYMDRHGGGDIEEWISGDDGHTWDFLRKVSPDDPKYAGWRFNNVQPVVNADGSIEDGMLLFYGWNDPDEPNAHAFLLHE